MWKDKVVIVTGASAGIGAEVAQILAARGARLSLVARRRERLAEVAGRCPGSPPLVVVADVSRRADCERAVAETVTALGGIDCLLLNAGIDVHADFLDLAPEDVERMVRRFYRRGAMG